jgi:hypothetical protein
MKKILFSLTLFLFGVFTYAQTSFDKQITDNSAKLKNASTVQEYQTLFSEFSSLKKIKNPNQWKAYYFASLSLYKKTDLLLKSKEYASLSETNALAYKDATAILSLQPKNSDLLNLIDLIETQKKLINQQKK